MALTSGRKATLAAITSTAANSDRKVARVVFCCPIVGLAVWAKERVVAIEIISFLSRPLSHSVRLFANMLAGHITLNVFGGFVVMLLGAAGLTKAIAVLPFAMTIGLDAHRDPPPGAA